MSKSVVDQSQTGVTLWTRFASRLVERIGVSLIGNPRHGAVTVILHDHDSPVPPATVGERRTI